MPRIYTGVDYEFLENKFRELGDRISESIDINLSEITEKLDMKLSDLRDYILGSENRSLTDVYGAILSVRGQLDITLTTFRDSILGSENKTLTDLDLRLQAIFGQLDVSLSTRASEVTLSGIKSQTDRLQFDANNFLRIALASDEIGIAKDSTLSDILNQLDVSLSSRASEATVSGIKSKIDRLKFDANDFLRIALANDEIGIAKDATLSSILAQLDVSLSTRASEATVSSILGQLDITLTELRDAIRGAGDKTLTDLDASLSAIRNALSSVGTDKLLTVPDNPPNFDVALSSRASEATVSGIKSQVDRLQFDSNNFLRIALAADELGLAKDSTLSAIKNALASIGTDSLLTTPDNPPNLDMSISGLLDGLRGGNNKTLTDLDQKLADILGQLDITLSQLRDALKPTRTSPVQVLSSTTIVGGGSAEFVVGSNETDGYSAVVVTVKATYNSSASNGVRVMWLYSPDGTNYDSDEEAVNVGNYDDIGVNPGESRIKTILIPLFMPYVKIKVVNLDVNYQVTVDAWRVLMR